jgi:hypothetical protein
MLTRRGGVKGSDLVSTVSGENLRRFGSLNLLSLCEDVGGAGRRRGPNFLSGGNSAVVSAGRYGGRWLGHLPRFRMGHRDLTSPGDDLIGRFGTPLGG